jgi:hypothetical protein
VASARQALLAEIDDAAKALLAYAKLQHAAPPVAEPQRRVLAAAVDASVQQCFVHLAGMLLHTDMRTAYAHYAYGGPQPRAYVIELLDNLLDHGLKRRLLPLLEAHSIDEQVARMREAGGLRSVCH